jgi:hypothetical protein
MDLFGDLLTTQNINACVAQAGTMTNESALQSLLQILDKLPKAALSFTDVQSMIAIALYLAPNEKKGLAIQTDPENNPFSQKKRLGRELDQGIFSSKGKDEGLTI